MQRYDTILLDIDGTIIDFFACEREALKKAFHSYRLDFNNEIYQIYSDINIKLWQQYEIGEISRETIFNSRFVKLFAKTGILNDGVEFEKKYQALLGKEHQLIPGALEIIEYLYEKYDLYIVTNGVAATQQKRIKESGLDGYMKEVFISEIIGFQKPRLEFFEYCFQRIRNFNKEKTLIIGDSLTSDIQGGVNAGISTCWYNPKNIENDLGLSITYSIKDLKELRLML